MKPIIYISAVLVLLCGQAIAQACTEATQLSDCTDTNLPICVGGVCSSCASADASACDTRYYGTPVCSSSGACVACASGSECSFDPARPICLTGPDYIGCYECTNTTLECYNATQGASPFCYTDGHCGGCASDFDCLMLTRSNAFVCNSNGVCEVPIIGPYMIATFVIIGFVILVFIIVISVVASKNKKNRQKRKSREAAKSDRKQEMQPLRAAEQQPASDHAVRKSVDQPRAVTKEGGKENLMTGAAVIPKEKKESSKSSSSSASSDSSSTSESPAPKPAVPAAVVAPVATTDAKEHSASSSVSGRSRSSSASSSSDSTEDKKESASGSSVTSSSN